LRIIITGARGFIGSKLVSALSDAFPDYEIIGIGRKDVSYSDKPASYRYVKGDLLTDNVYEILPENADILIHLAGDRRTFVRPDEYTEQLKSNVVVTAKVADYAASANVKLFIYASTVYVYSSVNSLPFLENSIAIPGENLGATKLASEAILKSRACAGQFKALSFRIGTVYGPGASSSQFIPQAIKKLTANGIEAEFGPGDIRKDFIYIDDVAKAYVRAIEVLYSKEFMYEALNLGTNVSTSIKDVVHLLSKIINSRKKIIFGTFKNIGSIADTDHQLDITHTREILDWYPEISIEEGLRKTVAAFL
jgi:UDP-glucose 4-epimerase